ncbi:HEAT repeat domain-containing protein [Leptospira ognonensis]|uniref:HEAT repeat domain-containing protein n=1 Tax=Leptospira ognonensis TaxID=2484945 RepID=UPI001FEA93A1|nr:HEAT repeat domain-containing protein [Leptospira ognonensis]
MKNLGKIWKTNISSKLSIVELWNWKDRGRLDLVCLFLLVSSFSIFSQNTEPNPPKEQPASIVPPAQKSKTKELTSEQIDKKRDVLSKVLRYGTSQERKQALFELVSFPKEHAKELYLYLGEMIRTEKDLGMKVVILRTIAELQLSEYKDSVILLFEDPNEDVTKQAVTTAKRLKIPEAVPPLIEKLKKEDFTKNSNAVTLYLNALSELPNGKDASPFLQTKFKEKFNNSDTRAQIALFFGSVADSDADALLQDVAFDDALPTTLRCYSINALGKIKSQAAKPKLFELLDSLKKTAGKLDGKKAQSLKIYTIGALVLLGDKAVIQELNEFARDDDAMVRLRVIEFMGNMKDPAALEILNYKKDRDPSPKVQKAAKRAIDQIEGKEVKPLDLDQDASEKDAQTDK